MSTGSVPCKICSGETALYGVVDFNKHCVTPGHPSCLPLCGVPIYYRQCKRCSFLFTDAFDDWSIEDFRTHIYNDQYALVDPEYALVRPRDNAAHVERCWGELRTTCRVLDFGGGNDMLCSILRDRGFVTAVSYDPIAPELAQRPEGKFDLVTCFETIEHMPDPLGGIAQIIEYSAEPGLIFFSTMLQPSDLNLVGLNWWYVAPRNGHVSMFTPQALAAAWGRYGYKTVSFNNCTHFAFRTLPACLGPLQNKVDDPGRQAEPNNGPIAA